MYLYVAKVPVLLQNHLFLSLYCITMRILSIVLLFFLGIAQGISQYIFSGEISRTAENKTVYLSLVENYRKSSRVYADQILKETQADANGYFKFEGDNLSEQNRIYRIHTDGCEDNAEGGSHFLKHCPDTQSVLFIAKKGDTILFPLLENNQPLCEINSTNKNADLLLEIDYLKEQMILDFMEYNSKANELLTFQKWFKIFQEYGEESGEPLAELFIYDFLSDRANETHPYYVVDAKTNPYYSQLAERLESQYPNIPFTQQYLNEIAADQLLQNQETSKSDSKILMYVVYGVLAIMLLQAIFFSIKFIRTKKRTKTSEKLTNQEQKVFNAIRKGKTNKEIASELFISLSTVKTHINNIYKKLQVNSREEIKKM